MCDRGVLCQPGGGAHKKLIAAALHWLSGGAASAAEQSAQFEDDAARYGIPLDLLQASAEVVPEEFEIWPENDVSLGVFLRCTTQWRHRQHGDTSRITGLDYAAVESVLRMYQVKSKREVFEDVRAMELAVLDKVNNPS